MPEKNQPLAPICWSTTAIQAGFLCFTQAGMMLFSQRNAECTSDAVRQRGDSPHFFAGILQLHLGAGQPLWHQAFDSISYFYGMRFNIHGVGNQAVTARRQGDLPRRQS